jgi:hypothetical protein
VTFCLGINVHEGLVGIADTRVLSRSECITARKVTVYQENDQTMFVMTSGLRSLRDKDLFHVIFTVVEIMFWFVVEVVPVSSVSLSSKVKQAKMAQ